jgi:hypothetical protein
MKPFPCSKTPRAGAQASIPVRFAELANLDFSGARAGVLDRARANLSPVARGARFADLPAPECEGVAFDPRTSRLFTGSADGRILAIARDGAISTFAQGLLQVLGIKVDERRRLLWAVSGRYPNLFAASPDPDTRYGGVRSFDIDSGRQAGAWDLDERPIRHGFNDLALARDGFTSAACAIKTWPAEKRYNALTARAHEFAPTIFERRFPMEDIKNGRNVYQARGRPF